MKIWQMLFGIVLMTGAATSAYAQRCACCGAAGAGTYNAAAETTLTGTIDDVTTMRPAGGAMGGIHVTLNTPAGVTDVHIGPTWYVASKNVEFAKGDALTVVGSSATLGGKNVIIAREVKRGDQVLILRDAKGVPLWSGPRRGR